MSIIDEAKQSESVTEKISFVDEAIIVKGDSAASHHYWQEEDKTVLLDKKASPGPSVLLLNSESMLSTSTGIIPLSKKLSTTASTAMILPGLKSASLISIGQLCDDNYDVFLNKKNLLAVKNKEIILEGTWNYTDGLWDIPVQKTTLSTLVHQ